MGRAMDNYEHIDRNTMERGENCKLEGENVIKIIYKKVYKSKEAS